MSFEIEVKCERCGEPLDVELVMVGRRFRPDQATLKVEPCEKCIQNAVDAAKEGDR